MNLCALQLPQPIKLSTSVTCARVPMLLVLLVRCHHLRLIDIRFYDLAREGRYSEAISEVDRGISSKPNYAQIYVLRAEMRFLSRDKQGASEDYQHAGTLFEGEGRIERAAQLRGLAAFRVDLAEKGLL